MWMAWTFLPLIQKSTLQELNKTKKCIRTLFIFILLYWLCLFSYLNWHNGTWSLLEICRFWVQNVKLGKIWPHHFNRLEKIYLEPKFHLPNLKNKKSGQQSGRQKIWKISYKSVCKTKIRNAPSKYISTQMCIFWGLVETNTKSISLRH